MEQVQAELVRFSSGSRKNKGTEGIERQLSKQNLNPRSNKRNYSSISDHISLYLLKGKEKQVSAIIHQASEGKEWDLQYYFHPALDNNPWKNSYSSSSKSDSDSDSKPTASSADPLTFTPAD